MANKEHAKDLARQLFTDSDGKIVRRLFDMFGLDWSHIKGLIEDMEDEELKELILDMEELEEPADEESE